MFISCLYYQIVSNIMALCEQVVTALLCGSQKGGLMNTDEFCKSINLDEMFFHTDLSPLALWQAVRAGLHLG